MVKQKVARPKPSHNSMGVHRSEPDKHDRELKTSGVANRDTMTNLPPTGDGSEARAQESPSMSDVKLEYNIIPPDKGKGKAVPDNTAQGGSGHDPLREWERTSRLLRWNESDDHSWSHSAHCHPTTRSDDKEILDGIISKMNEVVKHSDKIATEIIRRVEESCSEIWNSIANFHQHVKALRERCSKWGAETSHSQDGQLQTHHTRDDELGLSHQKDLHPARQTRWAGTPPI